MPDGQGQLSYFPLLDAERIEVLRGPFSALHGNATGGVLQLFTVDGVARWKWASKPPAAATATVASARNCAIVAAPSATCSASTTSPPTATATTAAPSARCSRASTTFQNAGDARRHGAEWSARVPLPARWRGEVALTWMDATFRDDFLVCAATPCAVPNVPVAANTRIPGAPRTSAHAALQWGSGAGWQARLQAQHVGAVQVNTTDDERAPAYTVFGVSTDYGFRRDDGDGRVFLAIGNLSDRHHAGSVIVNEGNRRYYEPAPARNVTVGFEWRVRAASR